MSRQSRGLFRRALDVTLLSPELGVIVLAWLIYSLCLAVDP